MRTSTWLCLVVATTVVSGCRFNLSVGDVEVIACSAADTACPSGRVCSLRLQRCIKENGDKDAPTVVSSSIQPGIVNRTGTTTLEFTTSEVLFDEPVLSLQGAVLTAREPAGAGEHFTFTYAVSPGDLEGSRQPTVSMTDLSGNDGTGTLGNLTFDFTPPRVLLLSVKIQPSLARPGESVLVQVAFSEALRDVPRIRAGTAAPLEALSSEGALATFQVPIPADAPDGLLELSLDRIVDLAGNDAVPGAIGSVRIDTTAPRITVLEIVNDVKVRSAQPGFNTFTVRVSGDAGTGDFLRTLEVRFLGNALTCRMPTTDSRECDVTITGTEPEGDVTLEALATDSAGNSYVKTLGIKLDFTPPQAVAETLQATLIPGANSLLQQVTGLTGGSRAVMTFSITEPLGAVAVVQLGNQPLTCTSTGLTFACSYVHSCNTLTDGPHALALTLTDRVGNTFQGNPLNTFAVTTDCTAPLPPRVGVAGKVVWHRAPFGSTWSLGRVGGRLALAADAVDEPGTTVRVGNDLGTGKLTAIGSVVVTTTSTDIPVTDEVDRVKVSVQAVDGAGNGSAVVAVQENIGTVAFFGPSATAASPGLFSSLASDTSLTREFGTAWQTPLLQQPTVLMQAASAPSPRSSRLTALPNGQAVLFGGYLLTENQQTPTADTWLFDVNSLTWAPVTSPLPPAVTSAAMVNTGDDQYVVFGGENGITQDMWGFNPATQQWSEITPGVKPQARSLGQMVRLASGKLLLFGGSDGSNGEPNATWLYTPGTQQWAQVQTATVTRRVGSQVRALSNGKAVRFGGVETSPFISIQFLINETLVFDESLKTWTAVTGTLPTGRVQYGLVSLTNNKLLLACGTGNGVILLPDPVPCDSWIFDGTTGAWTDVTGSAGPPSRTMAFNDLVALPNGKALLFGGTAVFQSPTPTLGDTWLFDSATNAWTAVTGPQPEPRLESAKVVLSTGDVLLYGGKNPTTNTLFSDAWLFTTATSTWRRLSISRPSPRYDFELAALPDGGALLTSGSRLLDNQALGDSYAFLEATGGWAAASGTPVPGYPVASVPLDSGNVLVQMVVNGVTHTWVFNATAHSWTEQTGTQPPSNSGRVQIVRLSGGAVVQYNTYDLSSLWRFNTSTGAWSEQRVNGSPPARYDVSLAAAANDTLMLFGGSRLVVPSTPFDDTWVTSANLTTWSALPNVVHPSERQATALTTLTDGRIMLFSGSGSTLSGTVPGDTWFYTPTSQSWAELVTAVHPPSLGGGQLRQLGNGTVVLFAGDTNWVFDVTTSTWAQVPGKQPRFGNRKSISLSNGKALVVEDENAVETWLASTGEASAAVGSLAIDRLGIMSTQISGLAARAAAGADGFTATDSAALPGAKLQLYRTAAQGPIFQTCASASGTPAAASTLECTSTGFTGSTHVALRVVPAGFSNGKKTGLTVNSAELDVKYRTAP